MLSQTGPFDSSWSETWMHNGGRRGWNELRQWHGHIYTTTYVKWIASGNLLCDAGSSTWCCEDLEGWDGVGVGGGFKRKGHMYTSG